MAVKDILAKLVAFPTVCQTPNKPSIDFVENELVGLGFRVNKLTGAPGRFSILASIGPETNNGIIFSAHSDVVPVEGQPWTSDPFTLTTKSDGKLVGRGTSDMKGFLACMLESAKHASSLAPQLKNPSHLAISYDEEIGCVGVRSLLEQLKETKFKARGCIIGEPTLMEQVTGHKGKLAIQVACSGLSAHSSNPAKGSNAVLLACDSIREVQESQADLEAMKESLDPTYDVPYSTAQVGVIKGGVALNIVPDSCVFQFEMRLLAGSDSQAYVQRIQDRADELVRERYPKGSVVITELNGYPGSNTADNDPFVQALPKQFIKKGISRISYGTEGGLFQEFLDNIPVVVCGPGSIDRAHKADEWVMPEELDEGVQFLKDVIDTL